MAGAAVGAEDLETPFSDIVATGISSSRSLSLSLVPILFRFGPSLPSLLLSFSLLFFFCSASVSISLPKVVRITRN